MEWLTTVQMTKDYYKPLFALTEPMLLKPRQFEVWERMGDDWVSVKSSIKREGLKL